MSKVHFELNEAGVRELLLSSEMEKTVSKHAGNAQSRLGSGYSTDSHRGKNRVNARVWAESKEAKEENSANNSLLKAVHK